MLQPSLPFPEQPAQPAQPAQTAQPAQPAQPGLPAAQPTEPAALAELPTIQTMLREFAKRPGCDRYKTDSERIKLLGQYLWLRQLTPSLSFDLFLQLFEPLADFDAENAKHPDDAIKAYLPRSAKAAGEAEKWAAAEVVDFVSLYVDMIRAAEVTQTPVPLTFQKFLQDQDIRAAVKRGEFKEPAAPKTKGKKQKKSETVATTPTEASQRCIYTAVGGRQYRGHVQELWADEAGHRYANFLADNGELFQGVGVGSLETTTAAEPLPPTDPTTDAPLATAAEHTLTLDPAERDNVMALLAGSEPRVDCPLGDSIHDIIHDFGEYFACLGITNGETGPYVDPYFVRKDRAETVCELEPRKNLAGLYTFTADGTVYTLKVA